MSGRGQGSWGPGRVSQHSPVATRLPPFQDPDLEAKRKAELAKIKQKNRRFKEKV